jgi:hypothetical protein
MLAQLTPGAEVFESEPGDGAEMANIAGAERLTSFAGGGSDEGVGDP